MAFLPVRLPALGITLYYSPTAAHPALQSSRHCLLNFEVPSHSLTHSLPPINLPLRCPLRVFRHACQTASLLSGLDERTYDHLNKHSHSMASLSARPLGKGFLCVAHARARTTSADVSVTVCADIMLLDDPRSSCVWCEVDVEALGFDPLSSAKPRWAAASADVLTAVPVKGLLSHLLSMPVPAIRCDNQTEKRPFFPLACISTQ